jgi:hypothetical protein
MRFSSRTMLAYLALIPYCLLLLLTAVPHSHGNRGSMTPSRLVGFRLISPAGITDTADDACSRCQWLIGSVASGGIVLPPSLQITPAILLTSTEDRFVFSTPSTLRSPRAPPAPGITLHA